MYILAYTYPFMAFIANVTLVVLLAVTLLDILLVFSSKEPLTVKREVADRLSLGDDNPQGIQLTFKDLFSLPRAGGRVRP